MYRLSRIAALILWAIFCLSCTAAPVTPAYTRLTEGTLSDSGPLPVPEETPILTIRGLVGRTNVDSHIEMDRPMLEAVGLVEYTVEDPFTEEITTYEGVLMSDLLTLWGVDDSAKQLDVDALNDYQVNIPIEILRDFPTILALKVNGEVMDVATRGPSMLVLPYGEYEFERPLSDTYWVWQVRSMRVE